GLEVIAGLWSGSLALIADAGHMLTDAASLALALYAAAVSRRGADSRRTYGYGRARVLAAFVNGLSLLLISAWISVEA
ncbi:cation diffusion facilitator family transporter, partial [Acinetobacter baumannii]